MREGNIFNGSYFIPKNTLRDLTTTPNSFLKKRSTKLFEQRFEYFDDVPIKSYDVSKWTGTFLLLNTIIPKTKINTNKKTLNIFYLDIINIYRGWRHSRGLPVRGQRT